MLGPLALFLLPSFLSCFFSARVSPSSAGLLKLPNADHHCVERTAINPVLNERFQPDITHGWVEGMKKTVARLSVFVYDCRVDACMFAIEAERGDEKRCIFASEAVQVVQE